MHVTFADYNPVQASGEFGLYRCFEMDGRSTPPVIGGVRRFGFIVAASERTISLCHELSPTLLARIAALETRLHRRIIDFWH